MISSWLFIKKKVSKKKEILNSPKNIFAKQKQKKHLIFCKIPKDSLGCRKKYLY
jgi:hypothetical protein